MTVCSLLAGCIFSKCIPRSSFLQCTFSSTISKSSSPSLQNQDKMNLTYVGKNNKGISTWATKKYQVFPLESHPLNHRNTTFWLFIICATIIFWAVGPCFLRVIVCGWECTTSQDHQPTSGAKDCQVTKRMRNSFCNSNNQHNLSIVCVTVQCCTMFHQISTM